MSNFNFDGKPGKNGRTDIEKQKVLGGTEYYDQEKTDPYQGTRDDGGGGRKIPRHRDELKNLQGEILFSLTEIEQWKKDNPGVDFSQL